MFEQQVHGGVGQGLGYGLTEDLITREGKALSGDLSTYLIPGAMDAGLDSLLFWGSLAVALVIAAAFAFPVNRWLISRGKGHAVVHQHHRG